MTRSSVLHPRGFFRLVLPAAILILTFLAGPANAGVHREWAVYQNDGGRDTVTAMAVDSAGNTVVTGYSDLHVYEEGVTTKYSPSGALLWSKRYGLSNYNYRPVDLKLDLLGNVFITGTLYDSSSTPLYFVTIRFLSDGTQATGWPKLYSNAYGTNFEAKAIGIHRMGSFPWSTDSIYVSGCYFSSALNSNVYVTIKYTSDGTPVWSTPQTDFVGQGKPVAQAVDDEGNVYLTGSQKIIGDSNYRFLTIKLNSSNGGDAWGWPQHWAFLPDTEAVPVALAVDTQGNVYVTGSVKYVVSPFNSIFATIKYDWNGDICTGWPRGAASYNNNTPVALALDSQGNVIVTGTGDDGSGGEDIYTVKYAPDGAELWNRRYNGGDFDQAKALALDGKDNIYVAGTCHNQVNLLLNWATMVKYTPAGLLNWQAAVVNYVTPVGLGLDSKRHVYMAGTYHPIFIPMHVYVAKYDQVNSVPLGLLLD